MSEFNSLCTEEEKQLEAALNLPAFKTRNALGPINYKLRFLLYLTIVCCGLLQKQKQSCKQTDFRALRLKLLL
jgi:hypothetical protein